MNAEFSTKIRALKDLLPHGYAKRVIALLAERGITVTEHNVYQVARGGNYNAHIVDALIEVAEERYHPRMKEQLKRIDRILGAVGAVGEEGE